MNELAELAKQGILGLLLVISIGGVVFLYKDGRKDNKERLSEMREVWEGDVKFREELKGINANTANLLQKIFDLLIQSKRK
jgi:hypothetical protein